ncbi:MAG TPA: hypothetical protein VJU61_28345 [Polyangiaceae bacterium]|nr:hypothetical protein [Polyangiaceae bacterium]
MMQSLGFRYVQGLKGRTLVRDDLLKVFPANVVAAHLLAPSLL